MLFCRNMQTNRWAGIALLAVGAIGLGSSSWLKQSLHLPPGHASNAIDFVFGLVLGLGIAMFVVGLSADSHPSSEPDE